ncbi:MAG: aldose 1-epimerase family protein [Planctomycetes bacterium]|nr:aldose 1-epimerase family protein [Planctomycetota bacterium]MCD7895826.1 aldose 1-epimerase family protein [Planctomycetaceae bacterium]
MADIYGKSLSREDLLRRVGNINQVGGIREYAYTGGRAAGTRAVEINTGLVTVEILLDRCMDISHASYLGVPFAYISKSNIRHPSYYSKIDPTGFQDNFFAGALTTCGLHNVGAASTAAGRDYQLHGIAANIPAEKISIRETWEGDDLVFTVEGDIHHSSFYHEDTVIHRRITARLGSPFIDIHDRVENRDFAPWPCLLLYHCQFGFPFLTKSSRLITSPILETRPRDAAAEAEMDRFDTFDAPKDGAGEVCFYHTLKADAAGHAGAALFNPNLGREGLGAFVRYDTGTLPRMIQWKMLRSREYVCGLEPISTWLDDRTPEMIKESNLKPLETRDFRLQLGVLPGEEAVRQHLNA